MKKNNQKKNKKHNKKEKEREANEGLFRAILEMELGEIRARKIEKENAKKRAEYMKELKKKEDSDNAKKDDMNKQRGTRNGNYRFQ